MILAININTVDGHGLNYKVCYELLPKNTSTAVLAVHFIVRAFTSCTILSGHAIWVAKPLKKTGL